MNTIRWLVAIGAMMTTTGVTSAHGILVNWKIVESKLIVTVMFDSDDPADDAEVSLVMKEGLVLSKQKTDLNGIVTFDLPATGEYRLIADAGAGHLFRKMITIGNVTPTNDDVPSSTRGMRTAIGFAIIAGLMTIWRLVARRKR